MLSISTQSYLGSNYLSQDKLEESKNHLDLAVHLCEDFLGPVARQTVTMMTSLIRTLSAMERLEEAESLV